jgi:hypothetical protein
MKRALLCFAVLYGMSARCFCGVQDPGALQLQVPKQIFIGDTAKIQYVFHSAVDFFSGDAVAAQRKELALTTDFPVFTALADECLVRSILLRRSGNEYTLILTVVPWKSGLLDLPPFDLQALIQVTAEKNGDTPAGSRSMAPGGSFPVDFDAVAVNSLVEKTLQTTMRPPVPPLVIPGTTWVLYTVILLLLGLVAVLFFIIRRIPLFAAGWRHMLQLIASRRNARSAVRRLENLFDFDGDDARFCSELQTILRRYLENRFGHRFSGVTTGDLLPVFTEILGGSLSPEQEDCVQDLAELFHRTDYLRYARGSADAARLPAERFQAALAPGEKGTLIALSVQAVTAFEGKNEQGGSDAGF